ncbi:MAG: FHA domain-containing protein [Chloroflexi bacterium]|nr:FHA domain-containing protein [Chloroflexota bacterium]
MKSSIFGITLIALAALAALALWLASASLVAARVGQQATATPEPTNGSCLTLPLEQQSGCLATKAAAEEILRQTQEVIGVTATAQAVEQQIQGTIAAQAATPTPAPTIAVVAPTPEGFSLVVPGLDIRLNLLSIAGLAVCGAGGIALIGLGIYLVRGAGGDEEEEASPVVVASATTEPSAEVRTLFRREPEPAPAPPPIAAPPAQAARVEPAAPAGFPVLIAGDGTHIPVTSGDFSIGRAAPNDFVVDARFPGFENVSAEHARLVQDAAGRWLIEDLGSANGTFINDRPTTMNVLSDGWRISLSSVQFTFRLPMPEERA